MKAPRLPPLSFVITKHETQRDIIKASSADNHRGVVAALKGIIGLFTLVSSSPAQPWQVTTAPPVPWQAVASSADFTKLIATGNWDIFDPQEPWYSYHEPFPIYTSADSGATWNLTSAPTNYWRAVASSADGTKLAAAADVIYISWDSGATWVQTSAPSNHWRAMASSADGTTMVAVAGSHWQPPYTYGGDTPGPIYTSSDSGLAWNQTSAPSNFWSGVASSADGNKLVAVAYGDLIYISTNAGATWVDSGAPPNNWVSVAGSSDGRVLVAAADIFGDQAIWLSTNGGLLWTNTEWVALDDWTAVACSSDGATIVALSSLYNAGDGLIYTSHDTGVTWSAQDAPVSEWSTVAVAADGNKFIAGALGDHYYNVQTLFTWPYAGPWRLLEAPADYWRGIASSVDAAKLVAAGEYSLYTSADAGTTWQVSDAPHHGWSSVASSGNGTNLAATETAGRIYRSSDGGAAWVQCTAPSNLWVSVASSADGHQLAAAASWRGIYTSPDSGGTWFETGAPRNSWRSLASSDDGTTLIAAADSISAFTNSGGVHISIGAIYLSTNSGVTWFSTSAPTTGWISVAASANGTRLAATTGEDIYVSVDGGLTWNPTPAPTNAWRAVTWSADGTRLVAAASGYLLPGQVYISSNEGRTWVQANAPAEPWRAITCSASADRIVVAAGTDPLGYLPWVPRPLALLSSPPLPPPSPPSPRLRMSAMPQGVLLSWQVPSSRFLLQESPDLSVLHWTNVTAAPTLNFNNLQYELSLPTPVGSRFYRLRLE